MKNRIQSGAIALVTLFWLISVSGCGSKESPMDAADPFEISWSQQVSQVSSGKGEVIDIRATAITDEQLAEIATLTNLRELKLLKGSITDKGLRTIANLSNLEELVLRDSPLTDDGAKVLATFPALKILNIPQSHIGDDGIKQLARMPSLALLRLGSDKPISASALESLKEAKQLRFVHLIGIPLTDDALLPLGEIPGLESLYVDDAKFSDTAISDLLKRRPGLHLHLDQRHHDSDPKSAEHDK